MESVSFQPGNESSLNSAFPSTRSLCRCSYSAAEMQAIDRTHRLGQHRPIRAVRFIVEGTVEERVLQLQEKKRLVFDGTVGRYVEPNIFVLYLP